jgi:methyl-accepting chemotaxis protein
MFNLNIVQRIFFGFTCILILTIIGTGIAVLGVSSVKKQFSTLIDEEFSAVRHISNAKIALLEARRPEKELLYADDPLLVKSSNEFADVVIKELGLVTASLQTHSTDVIRSELASISALAQDYKNNFNAMVAAPVGQDRVMKTLAIRKTANELNQKLNASLDAINKRIDVETSKTESSAVARISTAYGVVGITLLVGVVLALAIARGISKSLQKIKTTITEVHRTGDFSIKVNYQSSDEIGEAARAFDALMMELQQAIGEVRISTEAVGDAVIAMATAGDKVKSGSAGQATAAASVAAAIEQTSVSISETASNAKAADDLARRAHAGVDNALSAMRKTVSNVDDIASLIRNTSQSIGQLDESSSKIGGIVQVIKEIADQTNLLALNAAIEAARAGEQGRGFAVVADEVRKLAEKTTQATNEIAGLIGSIQTQINGAVEQMGEANTLTGQGLTLVERSESALNAVVNDSSNLVENVRAIANAMSEQNNAVQQVSSSVERIAQITEENNVAAQSAAETATLLDDLSSQLRTAVARFKTQA